MKTKQKYLLIGLLGFCLLGLYFVLVPEVPSLTTKNCIEPGRMLSEPQSVCCQGLEPFTASNRNTYCVKKNAQVTGECAGPGEGWVSPLIDDTKSPCCENLGVAFDSKSYGYCVHPEQKLNTLYEVNDR